MKTKRGNPLAGRRIGGEQGLDWGGMLDIESCGSFWYLVCATGAVRWFGKQTVRGGVKAGVILLPRRSANAGSGFGLIFQVVKAANR